MVEINTYNCRVFHLLLLSSPDVALMLLGCKKQQTKQKAYSPSAWVLFGWHAQRCFLINIYSIFSPFSRAHRDYSEVLNVDTGMSAYLRVYLNMLASVWHHSWQADSNCSIRLNTNVLAQFIWLIEYVHTHTSTWRNNFNNNTWVVFTKSSPKDLPH